MTESGPSVSDQPREPQIGDDVLFYYKHQTIRGRVRAIKVRRIMPWKYLLDYGVTVTWDTPGDLGSYRRTRWVRDSRILNLIAV